MKTLLWKTSAVTDALVYLLVTSVGLRSTYSHPGPKLLMLLWQCMTIKYLNFLYWCKAWICHKTTTLIEVTQGNRRNIFKGILHLVWSLILKTCFSSHKSHLFRQGLALIFLSGFWLSVKPAPRHAAGWLAQRSSSQQAGTGDVLEKLLRVGLSRRPVLWGSVLLWSPQTQKSCVSNNICSFPKSCNKHMTTSHSRNLLPVFIH